MNFDLLVLRQIRTCGKGHTELEEIDADASEGPAREGEKGNSQRTSRKFGLESWPYLDNEMVVLHSSPKTEMESGLSID